MPVGWLASLTAALALAAISPLVSGEVRARLDHVPIALLRLAIRRLPVSIRTDVGEEWEAELRHILRTDAAFPLTRLVHGFFFALGLLRAARQIGRQLTGVREHRLADADDVKGKDPRNGARVLSGWIIEANARRIPVGGMALALAAGTADGIQHGWGAGIALSLLILISRVCFQRFKIMLTRVVPPGQFALAARRSTRRRLARLARDDYVSLHGRTIPGTDLVIDHLIVGPTGVYVLGSQWWDRRLPLRLSMNSELYHGPVSRTHVILGLEQIASQVSALLAAGTSSPVSVQAGLVVYGPRLYVASAPLRKVNIIDPRALRKWLRHGAADLSTADVEKITCTAAHFLRPANDAQNHQHQLETA